MSSRLKSKTMRALPWSFVESLINGIVGLAQTFVLTWFLSPDQMGRALIALAIVGTVEVIATLGMVDAVIAASSSHTRITDTAFTGTMAATVVAMGLCWLAAGPVASLYGEPEVAGLLTLAILTLPFNNFVAVPTALFTRKMRAAVVTLRITMGRVMTLVAMAILAYFGYGAWAIVGGTVIGSAITAAVLLPAIARIPRLRFNFAEFKSLLVFGGALSFERLLWGAMTRLFWLIIGYLHGPAVLGFFQFAQRLVDETANLIQTFSIRFGLSFFAGMKRAGRDPTEAFLKASRIIGVVAAPVFTGIAIVMPDAIGSIFAERWEPAVIVSQIVALGWIFAFPRVLVGPLLRAQGHVGAIVFYAMLASATTLIAGGMTGGGRPSRYWPGMDRAARCRCCMEPPCDQALSRDRRVAADEPLLALPVGNGVHGGNRRMGGDPCSGMEPCQPLRPGSYGRGRQLCRLDIPDRPPERCSAAKRRSGYSRMKPSDTPGSIHHDSLTTVLRLPAC